MKPRSVSRLAISLPIAALLASPALQAATFYWDGTSPVSTAGFGTAGGTWAEDNTTSFNWTTSNTGAISGSNSQGTGNADAFNFGTATAGVAAGTITVSGTVNMGSTTYGSASGAIVLSGGTIAFSASPTITVNNASNTINSVLSSSMTGTFTKAGSGILILGGTNAYTGSTNITGGTLRAGAAAGGQAFGINSAVTLSNTSGVTLELNGFAQTIGSLAGGGATGGNVTLGNNATLTIGGNNTSTSFAGAISGTGTSGLTKNGTGTQTLTGANTYAGTTTINNGVLDLGGGTASGSLTSTVLTLAGGSFNFSRTGTNTQTFTTTSINGASMISGAAGNTLNLGTVSRGTNSRFYDFGSTGLSIVAASTASNVNGIMPGFTVGDSWAVANGTGVAISALTTYTLTSVAGTTGASYLNGNVDVDNSAGILDAAITGNSLRFSAAAANTLTLAAGTNTISSGGILVGSGVGAHVSTITGGTLTGAASKDLAIIQNNTSGGFTISSVIANNTSTSLTKSGAGLLTLDASNTFTGGLTINTGKVLLNNAGALNSTPGSENAVTFNAGTSGTLTLNGNNVILRSLATNTSTPGTATVENANAGNSILTIGNSANANSTYAGILQNGAGGGTLALTKAGTGTLTLSGANTYSGNTTLIAGSVALNNATGFGTSNVLVTGASRINAVGGLTYANAINVGAGLSLQIPSTTAGTATFSGQLTGSSPLTILATGVNAITSTLSFTNVNNTFTGNIIMPAGTSSSTPTASGNDFFNFNSIGDGGNITFQKSGHMNAVTYTGTSAIAFNTRQIVIGAVFGNASGGLFDGGGSTPINSFRNNATDAAHTVTFNTNITPGVIAANGSLFFAGTNTGDNTFAGVISNPTSGGNLGIGKADAGKWILTGANTYLGNVKVAGGTLSVNAITAAVTAQPLGNGTIIELGHQNTAGTLEFTGTTNSTTDKQVQMGNVNSNIGNAGGANILNNGSGSLTFSNANFNPTVATVTATRVLTLGGSNSGANTISGIIQNNASGGVVAITKADAGTWTLSNAASSYTGTTTIQAGTLVAGANAPSAAVGAFGNSSGALVLGNGSTSATNAPSLLISGAFTIGRAITVGSIANTAAYNATLGGSNTTGTSIYTGNITLNATATNYTATLQAATGGTTEFSTGTWTTNNKAIAIGSTGNTGTVKISNNIATSGGINLNFGTLALNSAFTSGNMTVASGTTLSGTGSVAGNTSVASATVNGTGLVLTGTTTFSGVGNTLSGTVTSTAGVTVASAAILANNGTLTGTVGVSSTATLNGSGSISGAVTVSATGILAPGNSIESLAVGSLSMASSSIYQYEVANNSTTGADLLAVGGTISLTSVNLSLDAASIAALSGGGWSGGNKLTLISYLDGGAGITSGFTGYADDTSYFFGANEWLFNYNDTVAGGNYSTDALAASQNRFVTMTLVPEPSAALLGSLGLLALFRRRK
jgi:fibronectin-binding autotransporter adhesin